MKSLDTLLAEAWDKMRSPTRTKFSKETGGKCLAQEALISIAESMLREDDEALGGKDERSPVPIRRNNGAQRQPGEAEGSIAESNRVLIEGLAKARPHTSGVLLEELNKESELTPQQKRDKDFCMLIGMSEADATKVVRWGGIRS